jgi:tetratricopeptide (TPR) repeat protein
MRNMHLADGKMIRIYRKQRGLTLKRVQELSITLGCYVSISTLKAMEACRRAVKLSTIECVAKVLDVNVAFIQGHASDKSAQGGGAGNDSPTRAWQTVQEGTAAPTRICLALSHDMAGRHRLALDLLDYALRALDAEELPMDAAAPGAGKPHAEDAKTWRNRAYLRLKRASILSNAGEHDRALQEFDALLAEPGARRRRTSDLVAWAQYHRAVVCRRLERFEEARGVFQGLLKRKPHANAAHHQLGVIQLLRAQKPGRDAASRVELLGGAEQSFLASLAGWGWNRGQVHYRSGFSLRRLGQLYSAQGRYSEAYSSLKDACTLFEREDCARYARATREDLDELPGHEGSTEN